jgi:hypothetical protein
MDEDCGIVKANRDWMRQVRKRRGVPAFSAFLFFYHHFYANKNYYYPNYAVQYSYYCFGQEYFYNISQYCYCAQKKDRRYHTTRSKKKNLRLCVVFIAYLS